MERKLDPHTEIRQGATAALSPSGNTSVIGFAELSTAVSNPECERLNDAPGDPIDAAVAIDLSKPDNSEYVKGRPAIVWALWYFLGAPFLASWWLPVSSLKCAVLRLFGAKLGRNVYIKPRVRVKFPWYLSIGDNSWIGEDVWIDNLAQVDIGANVCISQGAYLCTGNHDWTTIT